MHVVLAAHHASQCYRLDIHGNITGLQMATSKARFDIDTARLAAVPSRSWESARQILFSTVPVHSCLLSSLYNRY